MSCFAQNFLRTEEIHIKHILLLIFKQNLKNYLWTYHEDELLQNIIGFFKVSSKNQYFKKKKILESIFLRTQKKIGYSFQKYSINRQ